MKYFGAVLAIMCPFAPCHHFDRSGLEAVQQTDEFKNLTQCLRSVFVAQASLSSLYARQDAVTVLSNNEYTQGVRALELREDELTGSLASLLSEVLVEYPKGWGLDHTVGTIRNDVYKQFHTSGWSDDSKPPLLLSEPVVTQVTQTALTC